MFNAGGSALRLRFPSWVLLVCPEEAKVEVMVVLSDE